MKVAHVHRIRGIGGSERHLLTLLPALAARGVEPVMVGLDDPAGECEPFYGALVVLCVCRLEPQKGVDLAVRALASVADAVLVVLGEGPERPRLEALARELGVEERVHLAGRVPDVAAWLRRTTLLVHPVRWEGFGLAVLEAMLAGLPVVASRVSPLPELVADGETGVLVPPDDSDALAAGNR